MKRSAGIVLYRRTGAGADVGAGVEVLLGHMGGPYWARKEAGAWTIPKGEVESGEEALAVAQREFEEEIGVAVPSGALTDLGEIRQRGGKTVQAWAVEGDLDATTIVSNTFELEWPPRSGRFQSVPEIDRAAWFDLDSARAVIVQAQRELLDRLPI